MHSIYTVEGSAEHDETLRSPATWFVSSSFGQDPLTLSLIIQDSCWAAGTGKKRNDPKCLQNASSYDSIRSCKILEDLQKDA